MCNNCMILEELFMEARKEPHLHFVPVYQKLAEMINQNQLSVYAGDCRFEDALDVLAAEKHHTVCFYLKCEDCGTYFFFGACIRGVPKYRMVANIDEENIDRILWGREGNYFKEG